MNTVLRSASVLALASAALAAHGQFYTTRSFAASQTGGSVTSQGNGLNRYRTIISVTNTNLAAYNAYFVANSLQLSGNAATFDTTLDRWSVNGQIAQAVSPTFRLSMDRSVTDLPLNPAQGVTTASSLDAFFVGTFAPGETRSYAFDYDASSTATSLFFNGGFVTTPVPEPATCAAIGLGAIAMLRRRKRD